MDTKKETIFYLIGQESIKIMVGRKNGEGVEGHPKLSFMGKYRDKLSNINDQLISNPKWVLNRRGNRTATRAHIIWWDPDTNKPFLENTNTDTVKLIEGLRRQIRNQQSEINELNRIAFTLKGKDFLKERAHEEIGDWHRAKQKVSPFTPFFGDQFQAGMTDRYGGLGSDTVLSDKPSSPGQSTDI